MLSDTFFHLWHSRRDIIPRESLGSSLIKYGGFQKYFCLYAFICNIANVDEWFMYIQARYWILQVPYTLFYILEDARGLISLV
jgi:hypothetical protein